MTRREFLLLLGFNNAACTCHPKLMLNQRAPVTWINHDDSFTIHLSDDGRYAVTMYEGNPGMHYKLLVKYKFESAQAIPWPDQVKQYIGAKR